MEKRGEKSGYWILDARYWMLDAVISRIAILMEECIEKSVCKERVCVKALTFGCLQAFSLVCAGRCRILVASGFIPGIKYTQQPKGAFTKVAKSDGVARTANTP